MTTIFILFLVACATSCVFYSNAFAQVSIINDQTYPSEDSIHIVGEIENDSIVPLNQIFVTATFYDVNDKILGEGKTESILNTIMPGKKGPFDLTVMDKTLQEFDRYSLSLKYKPSFPKGESLEIISSDSKWDMLDNFIIRGTIVNHDQKTANMIALIATLYDSDGKVIATGKSFTEPDYLKTGEIRPFVVSIQDKEQSLKAAGYSLTAESEEYTAVPEFPIGSAIVLTISVLSYIYFTTKPNVLQKPLFV